MKDHLATLSGRVRELLARPYAMQAGVVAGAVVIGMGAGRLIFASGAPAPIEAVATTESPPPGNMDAREAMSAVPAPAGDWADSVPLPDFLLSPSAPGASRAYRPVGGGLAPTRGATPDRARIDPAAVRAVAVVRVSGGTVAAFDVGLGPSRDATLDAWRDWSLLGDCASDLRLTGPWPAGQGAVSGRLGEWVFALAVPAGACQPFGSRTAARHLPSAQLRNEIAFAVQSDPGVRAQGAPAFREADLREFADAGNVAWGVFRASVQTTQVYPPPPKPQLAFVATRQTSGQWALAWTHFSPTASEALGLAGAGDLDGDGVAEGYFGLRHEDGVAELLHVESRGGGWGLVRRIPLGRLVRR